MFGLVERRAATMTTQSAEGDATLLTLLDAKAYASFMDAASAVGASTPP